jgi:hypothetical protein
MRNKPRQSNLLDLLFSEPERVSKKTKKRAIREHLEKQKEEIEGVTLKIGHEDLTLVGVGFVNKEERMHMFFPTKGTADDYIKARTKRDKDQGNSFLMDIYDWEDYWDKFHKGKFKVGR